MLSTAPEERERLTLLIRPLMLLRNASQAILWYSFVFFPSISASFCICASLNGGMYTPPVLPVMVAGWSTSTLALGFGAGLAAAATVGAADATFSSLPVPSPFPPPLRDSSSLASLSLLVVLFFLSRPFSWRPLLLLLLLLRLLRLESRRARASSSLLLPLPLPLLLLRLRSLPELLLRRLLRPPSLRRFSDRSSRPLDDAAAVRDLDPLESFTSSLDLFPCDLDARESLSPPLSLPRLSALFELRPRRDPSSEDAPDEELEEDDDDGDSDDDDPDLPRFLRVSDMVFFRRFVRGVYQRQWGNGPWYATGTDTPTPVPFAVEKTTCDVALFS